MRSGPNKRGRTDSRIPDVEMKIIIEEVMYLLSLGYKEAQRTYILAGMAKAIDTFTPEQWIKLCDETLAWHCKNFYNIGKQYELSKRYP